MWLFTKHGFFSVVKKNDGFHIRARRREHLTELISVTKIDASPIWSPNADYRYRVVVDPKTWKKIGAQLIGGVDYGNYKQRAHGLSDWEFDRLLLNVWSETAQYQQ